MMLPFESNGRFQKLVFQLREHDNARNMLPF